MSRDTLFLDEYVYDTPLNDNNNKQHNQQQPITEKTPTTGKTIRIIAWGIPRPLRWTLSAMTCRPVTCVRKRDPQHPVSSPKIHRRSPIHSSLPSHRCAAVSTRMIVDGFLPGRREAVAFIRRVTRDAHKDQRSRRRPSRLFASASDARRALFFRSVRQEKLRPPRPPSRVGVPLAPKKHRPRLFSTAHPSAADEHVPQFIAIYIYSKLAASSRWRRE